MIFQDIIIGFSDIASALTSDLGVWWLLTPIIFLWLAMEVYFGEYKQEQLGFSSTLANGFSLFWISIMSFRVFLLFERAYANGAYRDMRVYILGFLVLYALAIIYFSFSHRLSAAIVQVLAGPSLTYFFSILSVLWGQRLLNVSLPIIYALCISFGILIFIFSLLRHQLGLRGEVERIRQLDGNNMNHA